MSTNLYGVSTGKPSAKPKHSLRQLAKRNQMCAKTNSHSTRRSNSTTMKPSLTQDSLAQQASTRVPHHQPPSAWNHHSHSAWGGPGSFHKELPTTSHLQHETIAHTGLLVPGVAQEASTKSSPPPATFSMKPSLTQCLGWPRKLPREFPTTSHLQHETIAHTGLLVPGVAQEASTRVPHHQPPSAWNHRSHRTLSAWGGPGSFHKSSPPPATFSMKPSLTQDS